MPYGLWNGATYIFTPTNGKDYVYAQGYTPMSGDLIQFSIEWVSDVEAGYRVTHIEPLLDSQS